MSFHFNFDALKNDNIDFPPDFMKSVYEHGDDSDLRIVLPGWRKFSDIEKSEIHFSADSKLLDKNNFKFSIMDQSNIFPLRNGVFSSNSEDSSFEYVPKPMASVAYV